MKPDWWYEAEEKVDSLVSGFTDKLLKKLAVSPEKVIVRKNPFLFRIRAGDANAHSLARTIIDAYMSSSEETIFGNMLESVAEILCKHGRGGKKSAASGLDLEYDVNSVRTIMQVKSGTNWGNSSQKKELVRAFNRATTILRQGDADLHVRCIEGCAYGQSGTKDFGTHHRVVGTDFWEEVSGWDGAAIEIMRLFGKHASNGLSDARLAAMKKMVEYLKQNGVVDDYDQILWDKFFMLIMAPKKAVNTQPTN